jgi:hypothetical protein
MDITIEEFVKSAKMDTTSLMDFAELEINVQQQPSIIPVSNVILDSFWQVVYA